MKTIVVEGRFDQVVLMTLFSQIEGKNITFREAMGFSNVFAISKTLVDYGHDVLAVLDTDSGKSGDDNRKILNRIMSPGVSGRMIDIVWMDPCIEDVLNKAVPDRNIHQKKGVVLRQVIDKYRAKILALDEFKQIQDFIDGK